MQESFFEKTIIDQQHLIAYASDPDTYETVSYTQLMDETVLKTRDQLEMSGANISTYIARIKGESNVFAADPMLRQYLSGKEDAPEPDLMGQIMTILSNDAYIKSLVVVSKDCLLYTSPISCFINQSKRMIRQKPSRLQ